MLLSDIKNWKKDLTRFWVRNLCGLYKVLFREDILQFINLMRLLSRCEESLAILLNSSGSIPVKISPGWVEITSLVGRHTLDNVKSLA